MEAIIKTLIGIVWSPVLVWLCLITGLFFSLRTRFVQIRHLGEMLRLLWRRESSDEGISSFQALMVALSGRVGIGNIAGVGAAIGFGGPGAVFWMWLSAFFGASTAYVESTLAQIYKVNDGGYRGGPAYYFERFFNKPKLGACCALAFVVSCGLFLPGLQANGVVHAITSIVGSGSPVKTSFGQVGSHQLLATVGILIVLGLIIFGGIKRIARFAEIIVPFMALGYIIIALFVVFMNIDKVPGLFGLIVSDAFSAQAGFGAAVGWGVRRAVQSNEAGQGTGAHHAAAAEVEHPVQQGLVQAFSVYVDTLFVCSATALMILITGQYNIQGALPAGQFIVQHLPADVVINSPAFTQLAMSSVFGSLGPIFTALAVFFFAFTTILAYYYIAETNMAYLTRHLNNDWGLFVVKLMVMLAVAYGSINSAGYIWDIGDLGVGLTAWLNIVGIILIYRAGQPTIKALEDYEAQQRAGVKRYHFDPEKLGIKNADFWSQRLAARRDADH